MRGFELGSPDAETGSVDFAGWAGLYKDFPEEGWYMIISESPLGTKTWSVYEESEEPSVILWANLERELEPDYEEPQEDDFVIQDRPQAGYDVKGETFEKYLDAVAYVRQQADEDNFYPSVWFMDDHGGFRLISEEVYGEEGVAPED